MVQNYHILAQSRFGLFAALWCIHDHRPRISRIVLPGPLQTAAERIRTLFPQSVEANEPEIEDICDSIADFLAGSDVVFSLETVRLDLCSPFQQSVLEAEHRIPRGMVSTYQRIARHLGNPSAARAVGSALATNPFPIIIPCHRAIRSDRTLGGYQGGIPMKRKLLKMEGICFDHAGKVAAESFFY